MYQQFIFEDYHFDAPTSTAYFNYSLDDKIYFEEKIIFPSGECSKSFEKALFGAWVMAGISYFKTYLPEKIIFKKGGLNQEQADFFTHVYTQGLGEFFYQNKINKPTEKIKFPVQTSADPFLSETLNLSGKLVALGGGKDSLVTIETLKEQDEDFNTWTVGDYKFLEPMVEKINKPHVKLQRFLDPQLQELNKQGAYNGHVPISAILAFLSVATALLLQKKEILLSNENSANFGNTKYKGLEINHQYSKSLDFEKRFQDYVQQFISPEVHYYSFLRPYSELEIAEQFGHKCWGKYKKLFTSCNTNFKHWGKKSETPLWCGECPKCAFVFAILAPFVDYSELVEIFGDDLLQNKKLEKLFSELKGESGIKPFECVGEASEVCEALGRLKIKKILIYGYGIEGQSTEKYLQYAYSQAVVTIFDEHKSGYSAPVDLNNFDLIFVSPGISRDKLKNIKPEKITSQVEEFFKNLSEAQRKKVIGISGTKGKSTTTKFIYEMLQRAGKDVAMGGNMGVPVLSLNKAEYYVLELSSFQLENLKISPGIAIFLNFFDDHVDRHGGRAGYFEAKKNLWLWQKEGDVLIQPGADVPPMKEDWFAKDSVCRAQHFRENFGTALALAKLLKINEKTVQETAQNFQTLPHRTEFIAEKNGVKFYNDSISTNPDSTLAAIKFFGEDLGSLILGGVSDGADYTGFLDQISEETNIILIDSPLSEILSSDRIILAKNMHEAVKLAAEKTKTGPVCLLSPAAKSFDRYSNYKARGEDFRKQVESI